MYFIKNAVCLPFAHNMEKLYECRDKNDIFQLNGLLLNLKNSLFFNSFKDVGENVVNIFSRIVQVENEIEKIQQHLAMTLTFLRNDVTVSMATFLSQYVDLAMNLKKCTRLSAFTVYLKQNN